MIIATGAEVPQAGARQSLRFEGAGVYYAATAMEAQVCAGDEVVVGAAATPRARRLCFSRRRPARHMLVAATRIGHDVPIFIRRIEDNHRSIAHEYEIAAEGKGISTSPLARQS